MEMSPTTMAYVGAVMRTDLIGRIKNTHLPVSKPLLPVLEAVSNSLHAIEDRGPTPRAELTCTSKRTWYNEG